MMKLFINIDGGSRGNPGPAASGCVLADAAGAVLLERGAFLGRATNNRAEYYALKMALEAALERGADEADIRSDSLLLVNQFNGKYKIKDAGLARMMGGIMELRRKFRAVRLSYVPREQNKRADLVVNRTLDAAAKNPAAAPEAVSSGEQQELF